jgi:glutaminase
MGIMSATLANGGFCPLTGDQVFSPQEVRSVLPLMLTCGMYDYSGQWAYDVGIPAKSGVGGCVYMVIPNVGGFSIWSPRLDPVGNSQRAVHAASVLVKYLALHNFEVFSGVNMNKMDITLPRYESLLSTEAKIFSAASYGDAAELMGMYNSGTNLFQGDYDARTPIHLAASEGQEEAVAFLLRVQIPPAPARGITSPACFSN